MSEKRFIGVSRCGNELTVKVWRQGASIKCPITGDSITCYPKPSDIRIMNKAVEICEGCDRP